MNRGNETRLEVVAVGQWLRTRKRARISNRGNKMGDDLRSSQEEQVLVNELYRSVVSSSVTEQVLVVELYNTNRDNWDAW